MGRKRKRTQHHSTSHQAADKSTQLRPIHLDISPEQFLKNGDIHKAIDALQTRLRTEPKDEDKRLLGDCYLQIENYTEAAKSFLALKTPTANDLCNAGIAWLNEREWERANTALQEALNLEEQAFILYLQALAIKSDQRKYSLHGEELERIIQLLQKARTLPGCPAEALLLLDDLLDDPDQGPDRTALLEEAVLLYPDHVELRLRYARNLVFKTRAYAEALVAVAPLLSQTPPSQRALDCALWSAFNLGLFERALAYANQLLPSSFWPYGPTIDQVKGDIYLAWGKFDEALAHYECETQREDFEAAFLGFFRIAKLWLVRSEPEKALSAALEGATFWMNYPNEMGCLRVLTHSSVSVGEGDDHTNACVHLSGEMVKEICETFLSAGQEISLDARGMFAYLLYQMYEESEPYDDEHETISKMNALLLTIEQGSLHPHMGEHLARHYANKKNMTRAIQVHLNYCLWKHSAAEHHGLRPSVTEKNQRWHDREWAFSEGDAEFWHGDEELDNLSEEERERCHSIAWEVLQTSVTETDVVVSIFVPFFHSFWSDLLIAGEMHHEVVKTARLLVQVSADDASLWWLLAYHAHELELDDEAERAYRRYLELKPDSANALHNLSLILEEKGELQDALTLSQKAAILGSDDEDIVENANRLTHIIADREQAQQKQDQQKQEGVALWSRLTSNQKWLLCLLTLYPSAHWSGLLPRIKQDENQIRQLQEDWEWLIAHQLCLPSEAEQPVRPIPLLESFVREDGYQHWLATEIARVQVRKKKNLWLPEASDLGDEQLANLSAPQRDLLQQAFMRQIAQVSLSGLEQLYLPFYRRIWRRLLIEWEMHAALADGYEVFLTRLSVMTRQEMWECAYHATHCSDYTYQNRAEKWYKVYLQQGEDPAAYHNLSFLYVKRKQYQDALQAIEQAVRLAPENPGELKQRAAIQQAIKEEEERKRARELEQRRQQEQREQRLQELEPNILAHLGDVDPYKQKILRELKETTYFSSKKAFARDLRMEDWALGGHWKKLVAWGMIIEDGRQPEVHPLVGTYLDRGWPVAPGPSMKTLIIHPQASSWTKPVFNSKQEYKLYQILLEMFPGQLVFPNMALQAIFPFAKMKELLAKEDFQYYMISSVDICLTRTTSYYPLVAFEVDGPWHEEEGQQRKDAQKNRIFEQGGLGLIRLQIGYQPLSTQGMWEEVRGKINQALYAWRSDPGRRGWAEDLETELGMSHLADEPSESRRLLDTEGDGQEKTV